MRMSKTFAVSTYSGGLPRIESIWTLPSLRSFFSWARRTRMSLARLSASMRWSSERTGAWAFDESTRGGSLPPSSARSNRLFLPVFQVFFHSLGTVVSEADGVLDRGESETLDLVEELGANTRGRAGVGEEDGSERHRGRAGGEQFEHVSARTDTAHADDRERRRAAARVHRGERDRLERGAREPAGGTAE